MPKKKNIFYDKSSCFPVIVAILLEICFCIFIISDSFGAYSCPAYKKYVSCSADKYLSGTSVGNSCYSCGANSHAPANNATTTCYCNAGYKNESGIAGSGASGGAANSATVSNGAACTVAADYLCIWANSGSDVNSCSGGDKFKITQTTNIDIGNGSCRLVYGSSNYWDGMDSTQYWWGTTMNCNDADSFDGDSFEDQLYNVYYTRSDVRPCCTCNSGYDFQGGDVGWYDTNSYDSQQSMINEMQRYVGASGNYGCFVKNYTISFNANGGSGTTASVSCTQKSNCTLTANGFSRAGYTFKRWCSNSNDTGTCYNNGATFDYQRLARTSGSITLYAQWTEIKCNAGYYLSAGTTCVLCTENHYCANNILYTCPGTLYSRAGSDEPGDCGRILHVNNDLIYLRSVKKTTPSLNVDIDGVVYYGNMSTNTSISKLQISSSGIQYSVYDDGM
jgi:uncharacterized repeat protein (TIGR02543 family)